ncbi:hypothetical protein EMIT091MI3_20091 [Kosakonia quasisacchari]
MTRRKTSKSSALSLEAREIQINLASGFISVRFKFYLEIETKPILFAAGRIFLYW